MKNTKKLVQCLVPIFSASALIIFLGSRNSTAQVCTNFWVNPQTGVEECLDGMANSRQSTRTTGFNSQLNQTEDQMYETQETSPSTVDPMNLPSSQPPNNNTQVEMPAPGIPIGEEALQIIKDTPNSVSGGSPANTDEAIPTTVAPQ